MVHFCAVAVVHFWVDVHSEDGLFSLDIVGGDIGSLVRELANKAGFGVVVYSHVHANAGGMQLYGVTLEEALEAILRGTTFAATRTGDTYFIGEAVTVRPDSPELTRAQLIRLQYIQPSELTAVLPASIPGQSIRAVPGQNAIVAFGGERLLSTIEDFVASMDVPQPVLQPVMVPLHHFSGEDIATVLARQFTAQSYQYLQSQNALLLTGTEATNRRIMEFVTAMDVPEMATRTVVLPLQHLKADDAKRLLPSSIDASRIMVMNEQNALIVTGRSSLIEQVRAYLADIDVRNPQIVFEVMIVEVNDRTSLQFGISGASSDGALKFDLGSAMPLTLALGPTSLVDARLTATLSTLIQEGKAKLLANPRLTTLSGLEASFNVLTTSRYWSPQVQPKEGDEGTTGGTVVSAFRTIETGIRLRLKPWVSASGDITIEMQPEISDSAGASAGSSLPSTNDRSVQTTVRVRDGDTIVICGLIQRNEHRGVAKVPLLGDLPLLGRLFRSETVSETETEFIIAITPKMID